MEPDPNHKSDADAVAAIVRRHIKPRIVGLTRGDDDTASVLLVPDGFRVQSLKPLLDEYRLAPERRKGTAKLGDLSSFVAHVVRFKDDGSALFAEPKASPPTLTAVLDYHHAGGDGPPRFGQHRAIYAFPVSDEWGAWTKMDGEAMSQTSFAEFIENRILDVTDPGNAGEAARQMVATLGCDLASPSRLLELSRGLSVRENSRARQVVNLSSGEAQIQYQTEHTDESGQPLSVPRAFLLAIPVFRNGDPYQVPVRLRYRLREGAVSWHYELYREERVFDHAFQEACDLARKETGCPLLVGSPEA